MDIIKLNLSVVLKQILNKNYKPLKKVSDNKLKTTSRLQSDSSQIAEVSLDLEELSSSESAFGQRIRSGHHGIAGAISDLQAEDSLLDMSGHPLTRGLPSERTLRFLGLLNWPNRAIYVNIVYKCFVLAIVGIRLNCIMIHYIENNLIFTENPVFITTTLLFAISCTMQIIISMYIALFKQHSIRHILREKKLCFLRVNVMKLIGSKTFHSYAYLTFTHCLLIKMASGRNFYQFLDDFRIGLFMLDFFSYLIANSWIFGLGFVDFYTRCAFGHWLLALKDHLEKQFMYIEQIRINQDTISRALDFKKRRLSLKVEVANKISPRKFSKMIHERKDLGDNRKNKLDRIQAGKSNQIELITIDQIQTSLNAMDDNLEILRTISSSYLLLNSLNCFLGVGILFLQAYHQLHNLGDKYHGLVNIAIACNYQLYQFVCYFGDSWLNYSLKSFVSFIEDAYHINPSTYSDNCNNGKSKQYLNEQQYSTESIQMTSGSLQYVNQISSYGFFLPRKKHVLFLNEFKEQFKQHLGTAWVYTTLKSNIFTIRALVTLIAAQIIFDQIH